jgi:hypothetical protein
MIRLDSDESGGRGVLGCQWDRSARGLPFGALCMNADPRSLSRSAARGQARIVMVHDHAWLRDLVLTLGLPAKEGVVPAQPGFPPGDETGAGS